MYVTVDIESGTVALAEPGVFTEFHVEATPVDATPAAVGAVLGDDGAPADDDHLWIRVDAIRRWAAPASADPASAATWDTDFAAMVGYAATKGWCTDDSSMIKAHIERTAATD